MPGTKLTTLTHFIPINQYGIRDVHLVQQYGKAHLAGMPVVNLPNEPVNEPRVQVVVVAENAEALNHIKLGNEGDRLTIQLPSSARAVGSCSGSAQRARA
ncbi:MAG: hypothetical protein R2857_13785 [Vampirovibrionales bacterium]